jgi:CheY-like chemotaxis protein
MPSDDPRLTSLIDNAVQGAERGAALTQRMLAFARKQELKLEAVELPGLMRSMVALLRPSLGPGIEVDIQLPASLPPVRSDAAQLEVALLNLAVNARDAMGDSGRILISAEPTKIDRPQLPGLPAGGYVRLVVRDTGEGMDEETLAKAAEPFFTTKGVGKGTGLGLAMVHGVAAQSGGQLVLRSRKGEWTAAELWLPVAAPVAVEAEAASPDAPDQTRRLTVLAVDDDTLVLVNTAYMLEDLGHDVIQASSGREALELVRSGRPIDLVVTDQAMPQMSGTQLAAMIRAERPDLPVLLATGYAEMAPGCDPGLPRLAKPFMQKDLAQAIARIAPKPGEA